MADDLDEAGEFALELAQKGAAKAGLAWLRSRLNASNDRFIELLRVEDNHRRAQRDWYVERRLQTLERAATDQEAFRADLAAMFEDTQFQRVQANLEYEAIRESLNERREMLGAAAAGLIDLDLSINEKARVERTLRALDPADVLLLRQLSQSDLDLTEVTLRGDVDSAVGFEGARRKALDAGPISRGVLISSACLEVDYSTGGPPEYKVTPLAHRVLQVLSDYLPDHA